MALSSQKCHHRQRSRRILSFGVSGCVIKDFLAKNQLTVIFPLHFFTVYGRERHKNVSQ
jgi:hypothetical protein